MEWFAVASNYYLDPKMAGAPATTERMFLRLLAYCAQAETFGFMPKNVHVLVGLRAGNGPIRDLIRREVVHENADGTMYFPAWDKWQQDGNDLVKRRKRDRERKRKQRKKEESVSRDMSQMSRPYITEQDITGQSTEVDRNTHSVVPAASGEVEKPSGPQVPIQGWKLVREHTPDALGQASRTMLSIRADEMLKSGTPEQDVRDCLDLWMSKPDAGPGLLPHLLSEVVKTRDHKPPVEGAATRGANEWIGIANKYGSADTTTELMKELER